MQYKMIAFSLGGFISLTPSVTLTAEIESLPVAWVCELGRADHVYKDGAAALSPGLGIFVSALLSITPPAKSIQSQSLQLVALNGNTFPHIRLPTTLPARPNLVKALLCGQANRNVAFVTKSREQGTLFVKLNELGAISAATNVLPLDSQADFLDIAATTDGCLVVGREFDDSLTVRLDEKGNKVWERKLDLGKSEMTTSCITSADGGFITATTSANYTKNQSSPSELFIAKLDASGNIQTQLELPGAKWHIGGELRWKLRCLLR
jgi:hypothetical protein